MDKDQLGLLFNFLSLLFVIATLLLSPEIVNLSTLTIAWIWSAGSVFVAQLIQKEPDWPPRVDGLLVCVHAMCSSYLQSLRAMMRLGKEALRGLPKGCHA